MYLDNDKLIHHVDEPRDGGEILLVRYRLEAASGSL